jgi:DNA-directed RNA polymerase specialized sigma24 family protein
MATAPSGPPPDFDPTQSMELVWQGQRGDTQAVNELFTRYIPRVRRILNVKIPSGQRTKVDPDDVLQETLIVATRRLPELELRSPASILQWLSKIADYEIKNRLEYVHAERRNPARERRMAVSDDSEELSGLRLPSADPTPSQFCSRDELEGLIDKHLQELEPPDYREVILQRDYCDADWETIRANMGRPSTAAVEDLYHRAHKRLQERIAKYLT